MDIDRKRAALETLRSFGEARRQGSVLDLVHGGTPMANKNHFTMDEWSAVRDAPQLVALAVALSGASGITGTIKETFSSSLAMVEGMKSDNELVRSFCAREEVQAAQAALKASLPQLEAISFDAMKQKLAALAQTRVREAVTAVRAKAADDLAAYQGFLKALGERVANAAKEGGFLGIGGERVSEGERQMLASLAEALGVTA